MPSYAAVCIGGQATGLFRTGRLGYRQPGTADELGTELKRQFDGVCRKNWDEFAYIGKVACGSPLDLLAVDTSRGTGVEVVSPLFDADQRPR